MRKPTRFMRLTVSVAALTVLAGCGGGFDLDFRDGASGLSTKAAAANATADRPRPDDRGVISYPNFQVAVAQKGDTVSTVASRIGMDSAALARYNGLQPDTALSRDAVLALPNRVAEPTIASGADAGAIDIATLATAAIDRADGAATPTKPATVTPSTPVIQGGPEPVRHRVDNGETVYSISRLYNVPVRALADWNGLGSDLTIRTGQTLLIPVAGNPPAQPKDRASPGQGSVTPTPPSAAKPLPQDDTVTKPAPAATPNLGASQSAASDEGQFAFPVQGAIINPYKKGKNEGIDIAAPAGTPVKAAGDGEVAAITRDVDQVAILVIRHSENILTVYANIDGIKVAKGDKIKRGQPIATVRESDPSFAHFEIRKGFESVDPLPFLQ